MMKSKRAIIEETQATIKAETNSQEHQCSTDNSKLIQALLFTS